MEQMMRLLHQCGLPVEDVDFINADGKAMNKLLIEVCHLKFNCLLFTDHGCCTVSIKENILVLAAMLDCCNSLSMKITVHDGFRRNLNFWKKIMCS